MYQPFYVCQGRNCFKSIRADGAYCQMCEDAFGWMPRRQLANPDSLMGVFRPFSAPELSERQAVTLMQEFAA